MSQKLATVWIVQDFASELFFNRGRLEALPATYTKLQAKKFQDQYTGKSIGATMNGSSTNLDTCELSAIECDLIYHERT